MLVDTIFFLFGVLALGLPIWQTAVVCLCTV